MESKANYLLVLFFTFLEKIWFLPYCFVIWIAIALARLRMKLILRLSYGNRVVLAQQSFSHNINSVLGRRESSNDSIGRGKIVIAINTWYYPICLEKTRKIWMDQNQNQSLKRLTRILTKHNGYYVWKKDEHFDISRHIRMYEGSEKILTESDLLEYAETLMEDMDTTRPQWELILIPHVNLREGQFEILISRFHQGYKKNLSFILKKTSILSNSSTSYSFTIEPNLQMSLTSRTLYTLSSLFLPLYGNPERTDECIWVCDIPRVKGSPRKILGWSDNLDFNQLKKIKCKSDLSINTLLCLIIGFAMKTVFEREPNFSLPPYFRFGTLKRNRSSFLSEFLLKDLIFPIFNGPHSINRKGILQLIQLNKGQLRSPAFLYHPDKLASLFSTFYATKLIEKPTKCQNTHTAFLYNFPITSNTLSAFGEDIEQIMAFAPLTPASGLSFASITYNNEMRICITASSAWIDRYHLKMLMNQINLEFQYLAKEILGEKQKIKFNANSQTHKIYRNGLVFP